MQRFVSYVQAVHCNVDYFCTKHIVLKTCSFMKKKKVKGKSFCIFDYLYSKRHVISIFRNVFIFKCINADLTCHQFLVFHLTVPLYVVGTITEHSPHVKSLLCESWDFNRGTFLQMNVSGLFSFLLFILESHMACDCPWAALAKHSRSKCHFLKRYLRLFI